MAGRYLTKEELAWGRKNEIILSNYSGQPMAKSKIAVSGGNPTPIGIYHYNQSTDNWAQTWREYIGAYVGHMAREMYVNYNLRTLRYFIPTRIRWLYVQTGGKGWGSRPHTLQIVNNGQVTATLLNAFIAQGEVALSDAQILAWDLTGDSGLNLQFRMKTSGTQAGITEIRGFQTPYPNLAALKDNEGNVNWPLQTIGYKDHNGNVYTAGRLL
jgi:hypothetical protein